MSTIVFSIPWKSCTSFRSLLEVFKVLGSLLFIPSALKQFNVFEIQLIQALEVK